ncbi:hypothetical protein B0H19DRAFT_373147 [Mycena capillaripes]|nr:hypothetical protein B0H19DRAFT_373147 [Mycena capillaripes]
MMHNSEPSENWDDDFEFHSNKTSRRSHQDHDSLLDQDQQHQDHDPPPHAHARHRDSHETTTENWDDDFAEDDDDDGHPSASASSAFALAAVQINTNPDTNSRTDPDPASPTTASSSSHASSSNSSNLHANSNALPPPPSTRGGSTGTHRTPRASKIAAARMRAGSGATARQDWGDSSDEDEFGAGADEEDRTVTARSRRTLAYNLNSSPPPPVPPLPGNMTPGSSIGRAFGVGLSIPDSGMGGGLQPFPPRSPTASVFSAPDNASIAWTYTSAGSETALNRPRQHHTHQAARGLAGLPPSPPIHRERERRRLRKKSRPKGAPVGVNAGGGVVEMREMPRRGGGVRESSEDETAEEEDWDAEDPVGVSAVYGPGSAHANSSVSGTSNGGSSMNANANSTVYPRPTFAPLTHPNASSSTHSTPYGMQPGASASGSHVVLNSPGGVGCWRGLGV